MCYYPLNMTRSTRTGLVTECSVWLASIATLVSLANCGGDAQGTSNGSAGAGGAGASANAGTSATGADGCIVDGVHYPVGAYYPIQGRGCGAGCYCMGQGVAPQCNYGSNIVILADCSYGGYRLEPGDRVPSVDDCNSCQCPVTGASCSMNAEQPVICTNLDCTGACSYAGRRYPSGESFPSTDGCNQCSCANGTVSSDDAACPCAPNQEGWRRYDKTNADDCATIDFECPTGSSVFTNACGCGCEQSPDCPSYIQCQTTGADAGVAGGSGVGCPSATVCPLAQSGIL
jgi:hypothetical protein